MLPAACCLTSRYPLKGLGWGLAFAWNWPLAWRLSPKHRWCVEFDGGSLVTWNSHSALAHDDCLCWFHSNSKQVLDMWSWYCGILWNRAWGQHLLTSWGMWCVQTTSPPWTLKCAWVDGLLISGCKSAAAQHKPICVYLKVNPICVQWGWLPGDGA